MVTQVQYPMETWFAEGEQRPLPASLKNKNHWRWMLRDAVRVAEETPQLRALGPKYSREDITRITRHNTAVGPIRTRDQDAVAAALARVVEDNLYRPLGGKTWLGIDGTISLSGKTFAVGSAALAESKRLWEMDGFRRPDRAQYLPYVYAEVAGSTDPLHIMTAIYGFINPLFRQWSAQRLLAELPALLAQIGNRAIIIDDAHHIEQGKRTTTERLPNFLKEMLGLPTTLVFVGINLSNSALLKPLNPRDETAVLQIRERRRSLKLTRYDPESKEDVRDFRNAMRALEQQLVTGRDDPAGLLTSSDALSLLINGSGGRVGRSIQWIVEAANKAVRAGAPFTLDTLRDTNPRAGHVAA